MLSFWIFLPLKEPLTIFNETCLPISRKYVSETGMSIPNLLEKLIFFAAALLRFCIRKLALKVVNFRISLPLKEPSVAISSETCAPTSRKYLAK